jgi:hypothetical protein
MIVWGGAGTAPSGARYEPVGDSWATVSTVSAPAGRENHAVVWTGDFMVVWGGNQGPSTPLGDGSRYSAADLDRDAVSDGCDNCPAVANAPQLDNDADDLGDACDVDDDNDAVLDGGDNCALLHNPSQTDLDGDSEGDPCDLDDGMTYVALRGRGLVDWQLESSFASWNLYRGDLDVLRSTGVYTQQPGSNGLAHRACGLAEPRFEDDTLPPAGAAAFYLVTGVSGGVEGDLGTDGDGAPRPNHHPCP